MHYAVLFLYIFIPLEILLIGIIALLILGILSRKITVKFPQLLSRMRIIYGYITILSSIVSLIFFWYIYAPFENNWQPYFGIKITPFSAGSFYVIGIVTVIVCFLSMVEISFENKKSYLLFIGLIFLESSSWFILASNNWINIFFGFILVFTGLNLFIRNIYQINEQDNQNVINNYLVFSSLSLSLLFIGISCMSFSGNLFNFTIQNSFRTLWEYIGVIFVIVSLLILIGVPPFHFWFFKTENSKYNSSSFIELVLQRGIALLFLLKFSLIISDSKISIVLVWTFLVLGLIYAFWGIFGSITQKSLQKFLYYISLMYIGILFMILPDIFSKSKSYEQLFDSIKTINFGIFVYMLLFSFSFSLFSSISKMYKSDELLTLGNISRNSILQFLANLLNSILLFISPIGLFIISKKYDFSSFSPESYVISIFFILILLLSLILFIKIMKALFISKKTEKYIIEKIEPGTVISSILLFVIIISVLILILQLLGFCSTISLNLLS